MPYDKLSELPDSVKDNLPKHALEIFLAHLDIYLSIELRTRPSIQSSNSGVICSIIK